MSEQINKGRLSDEDLKQVERIKKLLDLAARAGTPAEAENARTRAQELMTKYNLEQATVEANSGGQGRRLQEEVVGGFFSFHRELWSAVADLHFCVYWSQKFRTEEKVKQTHRVDGEYVGMRWVHAMRRRHSLVGRAVNVAMTKAMSGYLEGAVEKALRDAIAGKNAEGVYQENAKSKWAHDFRKGVAAGLVEKLQDKRMAELRKEDQERRRADKVAREGVSTSTAITISSLSQSEEDANADFMYGEGWSAERRQERAERAERRRRELEEYRQWCLENPEEAKKLRDDERKKEERNAARRTGRRSYGRADDTDLGAYYAGKDASEKIGLDPQTETRGRTAGRIG